MYNIKAMETLQAVSWHWIMLLTRCVSKRFVYAILLVGLLWHSDWFWLIAWLISLFWILQCHSGFWLKLGQSNVNRNPPSWSAQIAGRGIFFDVNTVCIYTCIFMYHTHTCAHLKLIWNIISLQNYLPSANPAERRVESKPKPLYKSNN